MTQEEAKTTQNRNQNLVLTILANDNPKIGKTIKTTSQKIKSRVDSTTTELSDPDQKLTMTRAAEKDSIRKMLIVAEFSKDEIIYIMETLQLDKFRTLLTMQEHTMLENYAND